MGTLSAVSVVLAIEIPLLRDRRRASSRRHVAATGQLHGRAGAARNGHRARGRRDHAVDEHVVVLDRVLSEGGEHALGVLPRVADANERDPDRPQRHLVLLVEGDAQGERHIGQRRGDRPGRPSDRQCHIDAATVTVGQAVRLRIRRVLFDRGIVLKVASRVEGSSRQPPDRAERHRLPGWPDRVIAGQVQPALYGFEVPVLRTHPPASSR